MEGRLKDIARHATQQPDNVALRDARTGLSFRQVSDRIETLAAGLLELGVPRGTPIAYLGTNGINLILVFLATQKAGLAFLPLSPQLPAHQIAEAMNSVNSTHCLTDRDELPEVPSHQALFMATFGQTAKMPSSWPDVPADTLSMVMRSSGSTGLPKMIPYTRFQTSASADAHALEFDQRPEDVLGHVGVFWMEASLVTLASGNCVECFDPTREDIADMAARLSAHKVTILFLYPALFRLIGALGQPLPSVRLMAVTGETITRREVEMFEEISGPDAEFLNFYSSMECSWVASFRHKHGDRLIGDVMSVGYAVGLNNVTIRAEDGAEMPTGKIGEIVTRSPMLVSGYIGETEKNAKSFRIDSDGQAAYFSGDYGYVDSDGALHFVGRRDDQVRISGFNLQPSLISAELLRHGDVEDAMVVAQAGPRGINSLHAFYVGSATPAGLTDFLARGLPRYMVPQTMTQLDAMPKTATDKPDKKALVSQIQTAPRESDKLESPLEQQIAQVWVDALDHKEFTRENSFFDVGGDSLRAMEMLLALEERIGRRVSMDQFVLGGGTIEGLKTALDTQIHQPVVTLKSGHGARRIYCAPMWDGGVRLLNPLAGAFDPRTQVMGITIDYSKRSQAFPIQQKGWEAAKHLPDDRERVILGYSFGSTVAVEMARVTQDVKTWLVIIDPLHKSFRRRRYLDYLAISFKRLFQSKRPIGRERGFAKDRLFQPAPINVAGALLIVGDDFPEFAVDPWRQVLGPKTEALKLSGDHVEMLRDGNAIEVAARITDWLDRNGAA